MKAFVFFKDKHATSVLSDIVIKKKNKQKQMEYFLKKMKMQIEFPPEEYISQLGKSQRVCFIRVTKDNGIMQYEFMKYMEKILLEKGVEHKESFLAPTNDNVISFEIDKAINKYQKTTFFHKYPSIIPAFIVVVTIVAITAIVAILKVTR